MHRRIAASGVERPQPLVLFEQRRARAPSARRCPGENTRRRPVSAMKEHSARKEAQSDPSAESAQGSRSSGASFVMTVWLEPREGEGDPEWRWRVSHAQTREEAHFRRLADVLAFIATQSGQAPPK